MLLANKSFDSYFAYFFGRNLFLFGTLCHHKSVKGLVYLSEPFSPFWELVISFFYNCFTFLNEINLWAWVFLFFFMLIGLYGVLVLNSSLNHVLIWLFHIIWITFWCVTLLCAFLICLVFCSNYISFWFLKVVCMHINYMYILWHACSLWSNI